MDSSFQTVKAADGYPLQVRVWQAAEPRATLLMLHGVVSHSLWLEPLAVPLAEKGITVICPDRRGAGANRDARGDAPDQQTLLEDVERVRQHFATAQAMHLCGFCWGSNYAINYALKFPGNMRSLALLAPAVFAAENLREAELNISDVAEATEVPIVPLDGFTRGPAYKGFILPDSSRVTHVSPRFNGIMQGFSQMIGIKLLKLPLPLLMVLAEQDRMTDNETTARVFNRFKTEPKHLEYVPGEHGVQFDAPVQTADALLAWLDRFNGETGA